MAKKRLTELVFDAENNLINSKTRAKVDAVPLGLPVGVIVPFPISDNPESQNYFNIEITLRHLQKFHAMYTRAGSCSNGNVRDANSYAFGLAGDDIFNTNGKRAYETEHRTLPSTTYRAGAVQFYRI